MSKKITKKYSVELKTKIVLEILSSDETISQIGAKYDISVKTLQFWRRQFTDNASIAFEPARAIVEYKEEIDSLKSENDKLAKSLGKAIIERDWAVGKLKSLDSSNKTCLVETKLKVSKTRQCEMLGVKRHKIYPRARLDKYNPDILNKIIKIYNENSEYGYRLIHKALKDMSIHIGRDRALKYMRQLGIRAICNQKKRSLRGKKREHKIYQYLLGEYWTQSNNKKIINVQSPNEVWAGDITYLKIKGETLYLAAIIDLHTRAILSYNVSYSMSTYLVTDVLKEAIAKCGCPKIFNSDQGSQYTAKEHVEILEQNNIQISMNGKGRSIDNVIMERFFKTLKYDGMMNNEIANAKQLKSALRKYIDKYNYDRPHSGINYKKPMELYCSYYKRAA